MKPIKVMFVCMGNICRSPTAHGIFQQLVINAELSDNIIVESSGTIGYHVGEHPDTRATAMAKSRGVELSSLTAQKVSVDDYQYQTYILAMDYENLRNMQAECPDSLHHKIELLLDYHPDHQLKEVPDPYYGGDQGFVCVYEMLELACESLLQEIKEKHFS